MLWSKNIFSYAIKIKTFDFVDFSARFTNFHFIEYF